MRILVACPACSRQLDAGELRPGSRIRCRCGTAIEVPEPRPHDAAVVRCSACGATRDGESESCAFCGSDFTLHERDLHTLCPTCMARISDRARYCHHCATRIAPQGRAGEPTPHRCPVCADDAQLASRRFDDTELAVEECGRCAGLWVDHDAVSMLVARARARSQTVPGMRTPSPMPVETSSGRLPSQPGSFYRTCPACDRLMQRRNWGLKSGVLVDVCAADGIWFDADELARILGWVREGGLELAAERARAAGPPEPTLTSGPAFASNRGGGWQAGSDSLFVDVLEQLAQLGLGLFIRR